MFTRREILAGGVLALATAAAASSPALAIPTPDPVARPDGGSINPFNQTVPAGHAYPPGLPGKDYSPVYTPNGSTLPFTLVDDVKVFHLVASEFEHEFAPGLTATCWGYNGQTPGPTLEAVEGDRVRVYVTNQLPEPTTVHWHGVLLPNGMDGVSGLTQKPIPPGETYVYEWTFRQHGTLMYHSHFDEMIQIALGLTGMIVVHPRDPSKLPPPPDRDFVLMLAEWKLDPGSTRPDPTTMTEFNVLTINGRSYPGTAPLVTKLGDKVRIRVGNLGPMSHHSFHIHGHHFTLTATDGGDIPLAAQHPRVTILSAVGETNTLELVADNPGDWAMHCHMTHHAMNQMAHGLPNMLGVNTSDLDAKVRKLLPGYMSMGQNGMGDMADMGMPNTPNTLPMTGGPGPFDYIGMGGMFTLLKVRADAGAYTDDPGWYAHPQGSVVGPANPDRMKSDLAAMPLGAVASTPAPIGATTRPTTQPSTQPTTKPATLYTCVMHPEIISDKPGRCPKCGMKLVVKK